MARHKDYQLLSYENRGNHAVSEISYGGVVYELSSQFSQEQDAPTQSDVCCDLAAYNYTQLQHLESE